MVYINIISIVALIIWSCYCLYNYKNNEAKNIKKHIEFCNEYISKKIRVYDIKCHEKKIECIVKEVYYDNYFLIDSPVLGILLAALTLLTDINEMQDFYFLKLIIIFFILLIFNTKYKYYIKGKMEQKLDYYIYENKFMLRK